ncbi:MAG: N-acetyl sugar amidotransferase [Pseudomonadota bacterium]
MTGTVTKFELETRMCSKLVMDTTDPDIKFDTDGVCNYWHEYQVFRSKLPTSDDRQKRLQQVLAAIRAAGKNKEYDCVLGISGGVDSSYMALLAKENGLRPLVAHVDNGWNSELAVDNIETILSALEYDLQTYVLEWDQFRDLQRSYFKASVIDLEVPTDNLIGGCLQRIAVKNGIKWILSGNNHATEWLMPSAWIHSKHDGVNLRNIHQTFGERKTGKLPVSDVWTGAYYNQIRRLREAKLLNLVEYRKKEAKRRLIEELGWRDYGGKHYESVFTRFYQGYILPMKFNVDKRKAHLSSLILTGEITREQALEELQKPTYDYGAQMRDKEYVAKKLRFTTEAFDDVLSLDNVPHTKYGTDRLLRARYMKTLRALGRIKRLFLGDR